MARFHHAVVLEPIPRDWFDENVGLGHDVLTEHLGGEHVPLVDGEHLRPGAWYSSVDEAVTVRIDSWDRRRETAGEVHIVESTSAWIGRLRLVSAAAPRMAEVSVEFRTKAPRGLGWLAWGKGQARADLERWWHCVSVDGGGAVIEGWVRHAAVRASFAITPAPVPGGGWRVTVDGRLRGRGVLAPLTALALLFLRGAARREFAKAMDEFAEEWNEEVPELLATRSSTSGMSALESWLRGAR